jgi:putative FmdB family regulatory protein
VHHRRATAHHDDDLTMPLYEYECQNGHRFERIQKFSDPPVATCPTCESPVRKLLSSPAIQFKGSGWYITDYAKKGSAGSSEKKSEGKSEGSEEKAKPAESSGSDKPATPSPKAD